jgi:lipopolysaccharide export system permease protein
MVIGQTIKLTGLVLAVVGVLAGLFLFIDNQHDVGVGQFSVRDAFGLVFLELPAQLTQLMPLSALLGALLGLGQLGRERAFIIARSVGVSPWRLARAAAIAGLLLSLSSILVSEWINPSLTVIADQWRDQAKGVAETDHHGSVVWVRDGQRFFKIGEPSRGQVQNGVQIFEFKSNEAQRDELLSVAIARHGSIDGDGHWQLKDVGRWEFSDKAVAFSSMPSLELDSGAFDQAIHSAVADPDGLSMVDCVRQIHFLSANGQSARAFEMSLHNRLSHAMATIVLCMLAVAFVMSAQRGGQSRQIAIGLLIGLIYFLITRTSETAGAVYNLSPVWIAWAPLLLLSAITSLFIRGSR